MAKLYPVQIVAVVRESAGQQLTSAAETYGVSQAEVVRRALDAGMAAAVRGLEREAQRERAREAKAAVGA